MRTKENRIKVVVSVLALAGLLGILTLATAGNLEPSGPPASTMKTLDEIYDAVIVASSGISEREGYLQHVELSPGGSYTFFTVPTGKRFVLLKLYLYGPDMSLTSTGGLSIDGSYFPYQSDAQYQPVDFPDRCVVVNAGETLMVSNPYIYSYPATILGYFYDVE